MPGLEERYPDYSDKIKKAKDAGFSEYEIELKLKQKGIVPKDKKDKSFLETVGEKLLPLARLGTPGQNPLEALSVFSIPQNLVTAAISGEEQGETFTKRFEKGIEPSELLGIGGVGGFAADVVLDPLNLLAGAGLVTKIGKGGKLLSLLSKGKKAQQAVAGANVAGRDILGELAQKSAGKLDIAKVGESTLLKHPVPKAEALIDQDVVSAFRKPTFSKELFENIKSGATPDDVTRINAKIDAGEVLSPQEVAIHTKGLIAETSNIIDNALNQVLHPDILRALRTSQKWGQTGFAVRERNVALIRSINEQLKLLPESQARGVKRLLQEAGIFEKGEINPGMIRKFVEFSTMIKLTGLSTHIRSTIGNLSELVLRYPEKVGSGVIDTILYGSKRLFGKATKRDVYASEVVPELLGTLYGFNKAVKRATQMLKSPTMLFEEMTKAGEASFRTGGAIGGTLGEIVRFPGRVIGSIDIFFRELNRGAEIGALAYRNALKEGKRGADLFKTAANYLNKPTKEMTEIAAKSAQKRVFQEELGGFVRDFNMMREKNPILRLVVPFFNTPINLLKRSLQRTPGTIVLPSTWKTILGKGAVKGNSAEAIELAGRAFTGSLFGAGALSLGLQNKLSGFGPKSKAKRQMMRATGWQPMSIDIGGNWYSYRGFEPISSWMRVLADVKEKSEGSIADTAGNIVFSYMKQFSENPFFMGFNDLQEAFSDPERNLGNIFSSLVIGSTVPNILQQWGTRVWDPVVREPKTVGERIRSRLPFGISKSVKPMRNIYGEQIVRDVPWAAALGFGISLKKGSKADRELNRLNIAVGLPSRNIEGTELSDDEYDRLIVLKGSMLKQGLEKMINNPTYDKISDQQKIDLIRKTIRKTNDFTRKREFEKYYMNKR